MLQSNMEREGTRDYRYFSGLYLMIRVLHIIPFDYKTISDIRFIFIPLLFSYAFAVLRPYKRHIYNMCDSLFFFLYALCIWLIFSPYLNKHSIVLVYMYALFGMMYISFFIVIKILKTVTPGFHDMCQRKFLRSAHNLTYCMDEPSGISNNTISLRQSNEHQPLLSTEKS